VTDDGLPNPPGNVTTTWTKVSGPGMVTFANAGVVDTLASFSQAGVYVLRLTANDGSLSSNADVTITVTPQNQPPSVDAGPAQTVKFSNAAALDGTVTDDGLHKSVIGCLMGRETSPYKIWGIKEIVWLSNLPLRDEALGFNTFPISPQAQSR